jgi:hypothetical protein
MNKISMLLTQRGEEFIQRFGTSPPPENTSHPINPPESMPRGYHGSSYDYKKDQGGFGEDSSGHERQYTYHDGDDPVSGESGEYYDDVDSANYGGDAGGFSGPAQYHGTTDYTAHDENFNVVYSREGTMPNMQQVI